jgi:hypothetical protein
VSGFREGNPSQSVWIEIGGTTYLLPTLALLLGCRPGPRVGTRQEGVDVAYPPTLRRAGGNGAYHQAARVGRHLRAIPTMIAGVYGMNFEFAGARATRW